jgi:hypothetical protein
MQTVREFENWGRYNIRGGGVPDTSYPSGTEFDNRCIDGRTRFGILLLIDIAMDHAYSVANTRKGNVVDRPNEERFIIDS